MYDIVIAHHECDNYRLINLCKIIEYYQKKLPESKIIIAEWNSKSQLPYDVTRIEVEHFDGESFNRSKIFNRGFKETTTDFVILADNDCILGDAFFNDLKNGKFKKETFVIPYSKCVDLNMKQTSQFINENVLSQGKFRGLHGNTAGGVTLINRDAFIEIGGMDEDLFKSWGGEDDAFTVKANRLLKPSVMRYNGTQLYHLYHPRVSNGKIAHQRIVDNLNSIPLNSLKEYVEKNKYHIV
jgi:predicted glycosyltransferase involved in capsule biosynthesis